MARFTECGVWSAKFGIKRCIMPAFIALCCATPAFADNDELLTAPDALSYKWFASTDPKHQNDDFLLLKPGETRKIPLAAGRLERFWWTAIEPNAVQVKLFDHAIIQGPEDGLWGTQRHEKATVFMSDMEFLAFPYRKWPKAGLSVLSVSPGPIDLSSSAFLQVINNSKSPEGNKFFYQVSIRPSLWRDAWFLPLSRPKETRKNSLAPGAEAVTDFPGAGVIGGINLTLQKPDDVKSLRLRAAWDGESANAVDAPLSSLLGVFDGGKKVESSAFSFDGKTAVLKWLMPFSKGAKITFVNTGSAPIAFESKISHLQAKTPLLYRFHAVYGSTRTELKKPVRMLDVSGKGAFCGLNLSITPTADSSRRTFAYLEGNETISADGQRFEGTGTEDFFSSAWYFPKQPFSFPYHGMTFKSEAPPSVNAYRLMIPDAVPFKKSLRFDFEHGKANNTDDLIYRWVAFWYSEPNAKFTVLDAIPVGGGSSAASPTGGNGQVTLILTALASALIVGGGGAWWLRRAKK